ncbi:MAG: malto-oligosyltrehalose trehalohydrolase [Pseudomonadota bacterium]
MSAVGHYPLPFGVEFVEAGARFRLWAPAARRVDLVLADGDAADVAMTALADGWFEVTTARARAGTRYRYRIDGALEVPDPAARAHDEESRSSVVVDPRSYHWQCNDWHARPWSEVVIYELHVGTFTPEGTYAGVQSRLDYLVDLGVTAIELMPLAEFPGQRGWGYDGVLPYAPDGAYGTPANLKSLIDAAHARGIAVLVDVVYNHFGPEGNYLHAYAPQFFTDRHQTPWGAAINFDGQHSRIVRDYFIHNALYWLKEYRFDGLRVDAVHAMKDDSPLHFIQELIQRVRAAAGDSSDCYIVLENHRNSSRLLGAPGAATTADAQWNDDFHHCLHVLLTGETDGYYIDYARNPHAQLGRVLAEGFCYQGDESEYEQGRRRGEPSATLPPSAFMNFLQTHDQVGNRAQGERLAQLASSDEALTAAVVILLLAPQPPMLFMGEEWAASQPFTYFCDFEPDLMSKVRDGRRREFASFARFSAAVADGADKLPDPGAVQTFLDAQLDWNCLDEPRHARWLALHRRLLKIRRERVAPLLDRIRSGHCLSAGPDGFIQVHWGLRGGGRLHLLANLAPRPLEITLPAGEVLMSTQADIEAGHGVDALEAWSVTWLLEPAGA